MARRQARGAAAARVLRRPALALLLLGAALLAGAVRADEVGATPVGLWQTISDVDGKPKALIRIREEQGEYVGVIEHIIEPDKRDKLCEECPGERHNRPVLGLKIITGVHRKDGRFGGGEILDPDNGKVYSCKLTVTGAGQRLDVRGYIGFSLLGRTQTWVRKE